MRVKNIKSLNSYLCILLISTVLLSYIPEVISLEEDLISVSPGIYDYKLGKDFPTEDSVKFHYPNSTILTNSIGELLFNVTLTTYNYTGGDYPDSIIKSISIYIPPEFTINNRLESVWTSFTNDYSSISLTSTSSHDLIAPDWSVIRISNLNITKTYEDVKNKVFIENRTQYIRIFNVTSPSIAGRYFFKVFLTANGFTYSIGSENFPTIVVKAELNPAYASGVIRYDDPLKPNLYGKPLDSTIHPDGTILLPEGYGGKVYAEGLTAEGRLVYAQTYFNASAEGRYTLYGLAPATYNVTVQAAGYPPKEFLKAFSVVRGQSMEGIDFYIEEGVNISGTVFSKHIHEKIPWGQVYNQSGLPNNRTIRVDITDLDERIVTTLPLRLVNPIPTLDPYGTNYNFTFKKEMSLDGHIPQDYANYTSGIPSGDYYMKAYVANYVQLTPTTVHITNDTKYVKADIDLQRTNFFEITVHFKDSPGNTKPMPTPIGGYLYLEALDGTGAVVGFNISYVPKGSSNFTMQIGGIDIRNRLRNPGTAWANAHDIGLFPGTYTINALFMNQSMDSIAINALLLATPEEREEYPTTAEELISITPVQSRSLEETNRQTPLYFQLSLIKATIGPFCNCATILSFDLVRGGGLNITIYSVNWQRPATEVKWAHPNSEISITIQTSDGTLINTIRARQPADNGSSLSISTLGEIEWENGTIVSGRALGLKPGQYYLTVRAAGYFEYQTSVPISVQISLGAVSDIPIKLVRGAGIDLTIIFKTENLFELIDNKLCYARPIHNIDASPVRIEVFDEYGELVDANTTYAKRGSSYLQFFFDGYNRYNGNPRMLWTNFYDTTDGSGLSVSGLDEGIYYIRISVPGYYQAELLEVVIYSGNINNRPIVSIETCIERLAYLSGTADWIDWQGIIHPLSWASITAYHAGGLEEVYTYPLDGFYEMWLIAGEHYFGLYHPGFVIKEVDYGLYVTWGACSSINFLMNEKMDSIENIPEFTSSGLVMIMVFSFVMLLIIIRLKSINTKIITHKQNYNKICIN